MLCEKLPLLGVALRVNEDMCNNQISLDDRGKCSKRSGSFAPRRAVQETGSLGSRALGHAVGSGGVGHGCGGRLSLPHGSHRFYLEDSLGTKDGLGEMRWCSRLVDGHRLSYPLCFV